MLEQIEDPFIALAKREESGEARATDKKHDSEPAATTGTESSRITLTKRAVARLRALRASESDAALTLRVSVQAGGCSGYRVDFSIDKTQRASDIEIKQDGVRVLMDRVSVRTIGTAQLDFQSALIGESFTLNVTDAHSACGCGVSFGL